MHKRFLSYFRSRTAAVVCAGAALSEAGFFGMRQWDEQKRRADFAVESERRVAAISRQIDGDLSALSALRGFMEVRQPLTEADFNGFAARLMESHPSLLAVEWVARVRGGAERRVFEEGLRRSAAASRGITEGRPGAGRAAAERSEYFSVRFLYPLNELNRSAVGYDLGSCGACRKALEKAAATGQPATMARLRILERTRDGFGVPVVLPAYRKGKGEGEEPSDYAMILLQVAGVVERALAPLGPEGVNVAFYDESATPATRFLYYHRSRLDPGGSNAPAENPIGGVGQWTYKQRLSVGSRSWQLVCTPTPAYAAAARTWRPWLILFSGSFLSLAIGGYYRTRADMNALKQAEAGARQLNERLEVLVSERTSRLRESEARLLTALDAVSDGFWDWTIATGEVYYSPQWVRLLGYAPEDVPPRVEFFFEITHPDDVCPATEAVEDRVAGRTPVRELEVRLKTKSGEYLPVNDRSRVVEWDEHGRATRMVGSITDITERKRAENTLREGKRLADFSAEVGACLSRRETLESAAQGCCEAMTEILGAAFARVWILNREEGVLELRASAGMCTHLDGPHGRVPVGECKIGRIARDGRPLATNRVFDDPEIGDPEWARREGLVAFAGYPLLVDGQVVGVAALFARHELNEATLQTLATAAGMIALNVHRAEAREAQRESDERMRQVLATALDAIVTMDARGCVTGWNARAEEMFGWPAPEALGRRLSELIVPPKHRAAHERGLRRFVQSGEDRIVNRQLELTALRRDGSEFPVELTMASVIIKGTRQFSSFIRDIASRKLLEAQLLQARKMESVGQLAGGIAHDFNNLLTVIGGAAQLGEMRLKKGGSAAKDLATIRDAAARAAALTQQILAFSRKQVLQPATVNLNALVRRTVDMLRRLICENVAISVDPGADLWGVTVDAGQFEQVILNLAINARDALPDGGRLTIRTRNVPVEDKEAKAFGGALAGPSVLLAVSDTGIGMDETIQRNIFDPFFTTKGPGKGTGLGLSVVYGVVRQSNGDIRVSSAPGKGTTFTILLPRADEAASGPQEMPETAVSRGNETILVVEDNQMVRNLVKDVLESAGYEVRVAGNGHEAITLLAGHFGRIHLLLTDLMMPEMDGRALAQRVKVSYPTMKILLTSGYVGDGVGFHKELGEGVAFIQKPYAVEALADKVREVLDA